MKNFTFFWVLSNFPIISTHYGIYILKVNCMKKIIALIAMLSVAFLASCTKEEVSTQETTTETPVVEVETTVETEGEAEAMVETEVTTEGEAEMNTEVEATIDMVEDAMEEMSVEAEMNTEAEMVK